MKSPETIRYPGTRPEPIDHMLSLWASQGRDVPVSPGDALAAADAALAAAARGPAVQRRWLPGAAMFGGGMAAAIAGVLVFSGTGPDAAPGAAPAADTQIASAPTAENIELASTFETDLGDAAPFGAPQRVGGDIPEIQTASLENDLGNMSFDGANDDLLMVGYVFTPRPEEELMLP